MTKPQGPMNISGEAVLSGLRIRYEVLGARERSAKTLVTAILNVAAAVILGQILKPTQ